MYGGTRGALGVDRLGVCEYSVPALVITHMVPEILLCLLRVAYLGAKFGAVTMTSIPIDSRRTQICGGPDGSSHLDCRRSV